MSGHVNSRNGSALLIVLGMLSFMVISAVAFSMFMRENRLPSSFLRQKLVANHLVKAALANAMNEIDAAIGSNPYPGVIASGGMSRTGGASLYGLSNEWENRVFTGKETDDNLRVGGEVDSTVPTLTLESLAYLPPPLINTVRYMSRNTATALWSQLKYDAGRYAYTAVNVSDYLDINRLRANVMRDSSPSNRVSLAYLFENEDHTGPASGASPEKFDEFIKKAREDGDYKSRLVSLADYNLAIGSSRSGTSSYGDIGFKSPFLEYIASEGEGLFYAGVANVMDTVKRQQFVTDSWYAGTSTNSVIYLTEDQPFPGKDPGLLAAGKDSNGGVCYNRIKRQMDLATFAALCDYVDEDDIPTSLAIPTIEHTPMLTGLSLTPGQNSIRIQLKHDKVTVSEETDENPAKMRSTWTIDSVNGDGLIFCTAHAVYPFKRTSSPNERDTYPVQVLVKAFFSSADFDFTGSTRLTGLSLKPKSKSDWKSQVIKQGDIPYQWTVLKTCTANVKQNRKAESDCEVKIDVGEIEFSDADFKGLGVFGVTYNVGDEQNATYDPVDIAKPLLYYDASGQLRSIRSDVAPAIGLKMNFAVYVRILGGESNNNTVDLVPAMCSDDEIYNDGYVSFDEESDIGSAMCGDKEPVLPASTSTLMDINPATFKAALAGNVTPGLPEDEGSATPLFICCDDPRFNFAPEDWYTVNSDSWSTWLDSATSRCDGNGGRQNDIFQFVSDCGYLQSMGELQFLPNLDQDGFYAYPNGSYDIQGTTYYNSSKYNGKPFKERTDATTTANRDFAWRTHWAFGTNADWADGPEYSPYNWDIADSRDGVVVSPYSKSDELLMAGLANTPCDWTVAGLAADGEFTADDIKQFCFNGYSGSEAPLDWEYLTDIATQLRSRLSAGQGWDNDLSNSSNDSDGWNKDWSKPGTILGVAVDGIHDVDRKFLYSYWKGCFGDRQQLFLIFVRAEPTSMGAGIGKKLLRTPAQLGARAVALVWREPVSSITSGDVPPHRMRILFYHQFE